LESVKAYLGRASGPVAAIGDSATDVEMLRAADIAYAPANASREVRDLVARGECRLASRPLQAGLLEAAMELCRGVGPIPGDDDQPLSLLDDLLQVPDRHPVKRALSAMLWWRL
jgi:hypothetical protein